MKRYESVTDINSLKRMESVYMLREGSMSFMHRNSKTKQSNSLGTAFPQNFEKVISLCSVVATLCFKVFSNGRIMEIRLCVDVSVRRCITPCDVYHVRFTAGHLHTYCPSEKRIDRPETDRLLLYRPLPRQLHKTNYNKLNS